MEIGDNIKVKNMKNEIKKLFERLTQLLIEKSELFKTGIAIKAKYILKIGVHELKRYQLFYQIQKIRREIALYQIAINRGEIITQEEVDKIISEEIKEYQKQLELLIAQHEFAKQFAKADKVSDEEYQQIKQLYREIVKRLHPDLNPDLEDEMKALWNMTQEAYTNNDLPKLQEIKELLDSNEVIISDTNELDKLIEKKTTLQRRIYEEKLRLRDMGDEFPYNKTTILEDEEMIGEIVSEINEEIKDFEKRYQELQIRLEFVKDPQRGIS